MRVCFEVWINVAGKKNKKIKKKIFKQNSKKDTYIQSLPTLWPIDGLLEANDGHIWADQTHAYLVDSMQSKEDK